MADFNITRNVTYNGLSRAIIMYNATGLIGCLLNGFVCIIISTRRALRQPFNHLILNLSVANFVLSFAIILYGLSNYLAAKLNLGNVSMVPADRVCKLDLFCYASSSTATILTIFVICIERYQAIATVRVHKIELSTIRRVIVLIWILSGISAIIPTYFGEIDSALHYTCRIGRIQSIFWMILSIVLFSITSIVPALLMLSGYILIIYKLYHNVQVSSSALSSTACNRKRHLRRSIIAIMFISTLSTSSCIPHLILNIILIIGQHFQENFKYTFLRKNLLAWNFFATSFMIVPAINPLLYNLASSQFRNVIYRIFCSHCHSRNSKTFMATPIHMRNIETFKSQSTKVSEQIPTISKSIHS